MQKMICECCGGAINPHTLKCEYCGTQYKRDEYENVCRIETYTNPVETLRVRQNISSEVARDIPLDDISRICLGEMAHQLAEIMYPYIKIRHEYDYKYDEHRITGEIKIVRPVND